MKKDRIPVTREGVPFVGTFVFWAVLLAILGLKWYAIAAGVCACFTLYFFRDPERLIPEGDALVVSPADGRVIRIDGVDAGPLVKGPRKRISIFMTVFDCHVNRMPSKGVVRGIEYTKGSFWPADHRKAFQKNEQNALVLETECGRLIEVVQVAGLIARRIVCWAEPGDRFRQGQRFGLIRFGSRVDVYLPDDAGIEVAIGEKVCAGETIIARFT